VAIISGNGTGDSAVVNGETYKITLAQVATSGNILLNGTSEVANAVIPTSNYTLTSATPFSNSSLAIDSTGTLLQLTFTATPEPEHIMLLCVGVLLVGLAVRRRWRQESSVASVA